MVLNSILFAGMGLLRKFQQYRRLPQVILHLSCTIYKGSIGGDVCCAVYNVRTPGQQSPPTSLLAGEVTGSVQTGQRKERER